MQCPRCQHDNPPGAKFCVECAGPIARHCPACGTEAPPTAKFCPACAAPIVESRESTVGSPPTPQPLTTNNRTTNNLPAGERRQLTVLFCDLVGSTEIAARLDPEDWHRISKEYQQVAAAAVTRFGGHVDKFLGDGLVCFFGVPQAHEDDAERAVRAGLAIVDEVQGLHAKAAEPAVRLQVRVGMHTGPAVVAHGGGESKDVFGDTPNIAARVQSAAEPDTVVITAATQRLVAGLFVVEERGAQRLKGVPEPVVLYRVVQPSGVRSRLDVSAGRHTPFVGRQTEIGVLSDAWERVVEGLGQTVLVQGEAGLGKSRLCYQLREQLSGEPHTWLECRCSPYTSGTAFRPVTELVEQALTFQPADTPAEKLEKLRTGLTRGGFAADEALPLLAEWLELPENAGYAPLQTSPDLKRRKTLETLAAWSLKLGELQPMVVLVEDLHWCDPSSLELLGRLVAQSATARVLLVGTARPEFANPWPARSNLQTLTLSRLTKRQMRELIAAVSAARGLPEPVMEQLVTRADGIPLFAEELTQAVVEAGGDAAVAEIPVTLQDSLLARLDRLSSAKDVAQRAAVLGREFSYALLAATAGLDEGALQQGLARLVEAELVFVRGEPPEATYTFKHALIQDTAYQSLLKRTRQQLHSRVAEVLEERFPERVAAEPEVVAWHYDHAGLVAQAITHYQRAGERATQRSANEEAIGHLRRALDLLATLPETRQRHQRELGLQMAIGAPLTAARGFSHPENEQAYARARELTSQIGESPELPRVLVGMADAYFVKGDLATSAEVAQEALAAAERTRDAFDLLSAHYQVGAPLLYQGHFSRALQHFEQGIRLYDPSAHGSLGYAMGIDRGLNAHAFAAWCHFYLGHPDRALAASEEAVALAQRVEHPLSLANALFSAAVVSALRGELDRTRERAGEVVGLAERLGFPLYLEAGRVMRGWARVESGECEAGIAEMQQALVELARIGTGIGAPRILLVLAEGLWKVGRHDDALGAVGVGVAQAEAQGQHYADADLHRLRAEILLDTNGDVVEEAEALFGQSLEIARRQEAKTFELRAATSLARLWKAQGKRNEARELLAPIYAWFTEGFDTRDLIEAKALLEKLG